MTKISDTHRIGTCGLYDGVQHLYSFPNGYGVSVVSHLGSLGGSQGLWEVGVLGFDGKLCYTTSVVPGDVAGYLDEDGVNKILAEIEALIVETIDE